jgi:CheY-like chemotaxis protein
VDDQQALLDLLASYLTRLGYEVDTCVSAQEALRRFREHPFSYALVLTDAKMPDMSGQELITRVIELNPEVRVILTSGSPIRMSELPPDPAGKVKFLQKPYGPAQLAQVVKALLES